MSLQWNALTPRLNSLTPYLQQRVVEVLEQMLEIHYKQYPTVIIEDVRLENGKITIVGMEIGANNNISDEED